MFFLGKQSLILGILIIIFAFIIFFDSLGVLPVETDQIFSVFWPFLLIIWGGDALMGDILGGKKYKKGKLVRFAGLVVFIIGLLVLGRNLGLYEMDFSVLWNFFWPLVLFYIGWSLIQGARNKGRPGIAVMSGLEVKDEGWLLEDKTYLAFMGGIDLDLERASIPEGETYLSLTAVMGGITLKVPENIDIECRGTAFLGGITFFGDDFGGVISSRSFKHTGSGEKKLILSCRSMMGGVEIIKV